MFHFDNSRVGNYCYINEHWYGVTEPKKTVIRLIKVSGWADRGLESTVFTEESDEMPNSVKEWMRR